MKKTLNKTPIKIKRNNTEYISPIHHFLKETNTEEEFIYESNPGKKHSVNLETDSKDNTIRKKKTTKRKNKSIDIGQNEINKMKNDISNSPKKVKKI